MMYDYLKEIAKAQEDFTNYPKDYKARKRVRDLKRSQTTMLYKLTIIEGMCFIIKDSKELGIAMKNFLYDQDQPPKFWREMAYRMPLGEIVERYLKMGE